jgi:DHA1 family tetracycline resistance protein-like MFS transporter
MSFAKFSRISQLHVVALVMLIDGIGLSIILPHIPFYVLELGGNAQFVAELFAFYTIASFFGAPIIGRLSDQFGVKRVLCLSLLGTMLSYVGMMFSNSLLLLLVFRAVGGATAGRDAVLQALISAEGDEATRAKRVGFATSAGLVGAASGPLIAAVVGLAIRNPPVEIEVALGVGLALVVGAFIVSGLALPNTPPGLVVSRGPGRLKAIGDLTNLKEQAIPICTRVGLNYGIGLAFAINTMFLFHEFGWRAANTAWLIGLTALFGAAGRGVIAQPMIRALGVNRTLLMVLAVGVATFIGMALSPSALIYAVFFVLYVLAHNVGLVCNVLQISERAAPTRRGLAFGVVESSGALALAFSATANGMLFASLGPRAPYLSAALALLITLTVLWVAFATVRRGRVVVVADET